MDISLTPELEKYVAEKVAAGQFTSVTDVVLGALEAMREEETLTAADIHELRAESATGIAQLERGEGAPWNVDEIRVEGQQRLNNRRKGG